MLTFGAATYGMLGRAGLDVTKASENFPEPTAVDGLEGVKVIGLSLLLFSFLS